MNNLKKLTQEELDGIEYAVLLTAMETGATEQEINEAKENLKKVHTGEWTDEDYRANIMKKHNLHMLDLQTPITKKPSTLKKAKGFVR
jgi:hypothetical protein